MVFNHLVKYNGKYYPSGTDVPLGEKTVDEKVEEKKLEVKTETKSEEFHFSKTEINRMSTAELKALAERNGVENADEMTGGELKKYFIEKFGL